MTRQKSDKTIKKDKKQKAEKPRINPEEPDLSTKRKLVLKLKQQPAWADRSMKECQQALEEVKWDYNALFVKKTRKRKNSVEDILSAVESNEDIEEETSDEEPDLSVLESSSDKKDKYVQGLDSKWVLQYKSDWVPSEIVVLAQVNKKLGTDYKSWNELSEKHEDLSEEFLTQYESYISFYHLFKTHNPDDYSVKFKKKMHDHFLISHLDLIPRNYKRKKDEKIEDTSEEI